MLTALLLAGCSGDAPVAAADPLDAGWPGVLVADPARFTAIIDRTGRAGWIAYHQGDLSGAERTLSGSAQARVASERAQLAGDLARLSDLAWEETFTTWYERVGLPEGSAAPVMAALSAAAAGDNARSKIWLERGGSYTDPQVAVLAEQLAGGLSAVEGSEGLLGCVAAHNRARQHREPEALSACAPGPLLVEPGERHARSLYNPLTFHTLAAVYAPAEYIPPEDPLELLLFSGDWTEDDRQEGEPAPIFATLGLTVPQSDDPEAARALVRGLDARLDAWTEQQLSGASAEGRELLEGLMLVEVFRGKALVDLSRHLLLADRPHAALAVGQLALDVEHGREIGPRNPPGLFALLAEASLRTGRSREALEYLAPLVVAWPQAAGLDETLGDLVILQGLERLGDSKEH